MPLYIEKKVEIQSGDTDVSLAHSLTLTDFKR